MKTVIILGEGLSGEPLAELNGKTVLEAAKTPQLDELAARGILGLTRFGAAPADGIVDAAALATLGYDPAVHRVGRGAFEAVGRGIELQQGDIAFCADLVSLLAQPDGTEVLAGMAGGAVDPAAALGLGQELAAVLNGAGLEILPYAGHRQLLLWRGGEAQMRTTAPAAVIDRPVAPNLPTGPGADTLREFMRRACEVLARHAVTDAAVREGRASANALWVWGPGTRPTLPSFVARAKGSVTAVTATPRGCGLARLARMTVVDGSAAANPWPLVQRGLETSDVCFLELDPFALNDLPARAHDRVEALEHIDQRLIVPLVEHLRAAGHPWRCLTVLSPVDPKGDQPVPFLVGVDRDQHGTRMLARRFHERDAREQGIFIPEAHTLMERVLRPE